MGNELISIIIPVYNSEKYLKKCLSSICNQSYKNIEIIIIDDGSTDSSDKIYKKFANKDARFRIEKQVNSGPSKARNLGIEKSNGKFISFIDSDDWISKEFYETLYADITCNSADMSCCMFQFVSSHYPEYEKLSKNKDVVPASKILDYCAYFDSSKNRGYGEGSIYGKLFRASLVRKLQTILYDESCNLGEDYKWLIEFVKRAKNATFNHSVMYHYNNLDTKSLSKSANSLEWFKFSKYKYDYYIKTNCSQKLINKANNEMERSAYALLENIRKEILIYSLTGPNKKIMFVTRSILGGSTGGTKRSVQNILGCRSYFETYVYTVRPIPNAFEQAKYNIFHKTIFISPKQYDEIIQLLKTFKFDYIFIDNSLYGSLACDIKKQFPNLKIIVHYHNIEQDIWYETYKFSKGSKIKLYNYLSYKTAKKNEYLASKFSDIRIFISEDDKKSAFEKYEIENNNNYVIPPVLKDDYLGEDSANTEEEASDLQNYVLFVGSAFYSNFKACDFIISEIAPYVKYKIVIAGYNIDNYYKESYKNVKVLGFVPNLKALYNHALAVVSPVFYGSGSKIKIAEALMYGKYIIGNKETFSGYDIANAEVRVCESSNQFIDAVNNLEPKKLFYKNNRNLFVKKYSIAKNPIYYKFLDEQKYEQKYKILEDEKINHLINLLGK